MLTLYDYFRSSAAFRVRIALNLKDLPFAKQEIHLLHDGGQQHSPAYKAINPQQLVPSLTIDNGATLTQSLAILEYLEEAYPKPSILPKNILARANARAIANMISCDIHPLNNLRVLQYLQQELKITDPQKMTWYHHWLKLGFDAIEAKIALDHNFDFCVSTEPSIADICLVPQVANAKRFEFDLEPYPNIRRINEKCLELAAFKMAAP